jgi:NTP pyrophosphatase (non-canonical NTP hydrolase)
MELKDYQEFVCGLMSPTSVVDMKSKLAVAGLGLTGEAGEVADICKKLLFHEMPFTEDIRMKLIKELGDSLFYLTFAAVMVCGVSLQEILDANVEKLQDRYKTGTFSVSEFMDKENKKSKDE